MYICICQGVSDEEIKEAILNGHATSLNCLKQKLGVASQCGKCAPDALSLLETHQDKSQTVNCSRDDRTCEFDVTTSE